MMLKIRENYPNKIKSVIAALILLPVFVQLAFGVYRSRTINFDSHGALLWLPMPIAAFICVGGILYFWNLRSVSISLKLIFITLILMVCSLIVTYLAQGGQWHTKFVMIAQFVFPMLGMAMGQCYEPDGTSSSFQNLGKGFVYILAVIVPVQLLCTWIQGMPYLAQYLYLFSIYQHLQYVPVIFVSAFLVSFGTLWQLRKYKKILATLVPLMSIYAAASMSMMAIALLVGGLLGYAIFLLRKSSDKTPLYLLLASVFLIWAWGHYQLANIHSSFSEKFAFVTIDKDDYEKILADVSIHKLPVNLNERIAYWKYYAKEINSSFMVFLFGHSEAPDRAQYPSAHNYYLDFVYNFGVLALLPMLIVLYLVLEMLYRLRRNIYVSMDLTGLSAVVLFLVLADNSLKVGLRQPYSGIFTFFLLGILISRLRYLEGLVLKEKRYATETN